MIPRIIHYCWFGNNKKSKLIRQCIKSWKNYCPDFQIIEWNESNFDVNICNYVREAYDCKMWAFVSDYVRYYVLNKFGGIYLDTDVELLRPIDELLLKQNFVGFESEKSVASGLILGVEKNNAVCAKMLQEYNSDSFILPDGTMNRYTVCQRMTKIFVDKGLVLNNTNQEVYDFKIFDSSYFNPLGIFCDGKIEPHSYSIHHYCKSWSTPKEKFIDFIGPELTNLILKVKHRLEGKRK